MPDSEHKKWIIIDSMSSPIFRSIPEGRDTGNVATDSFDFVADSSDPATDYEYELKEVLVSSYQTSGSADVAPLPDNDDAGMTFIDAFDFF